MKNKPKTISSPLDLFNVLHYQFPDIGLGGSLFLSQLNLLGRNPKDLDINIRENSKFIEYAKFLSKISPCKSYHYQYDSNHIRFRIGEIDVCVFIYDKNIFILDEILNAKIKYAKKPHTPSGQKHAKDLEYIRNIFETKPLMVKMLYLNNYLSREFKFPEQKNQNKNNILLLEDLPF